MATQKKVNPKILLWVVLPSIFLILMLGLKFVAVKYDLENKREIDELIRKQQALRHVPRADQQHSAQTQSTANTSSTVASEPQSH